MHVARRTHAPGIAAHRGRDVRRQPGAGVRPADGQRPGPAPRCGVPDAVRGVLRRRLPRGRRPDVPLRRADRRARQHQRDGDRRHAATRRSSSAAAAAARTSRPPSARSRCGPRGIAAAAPSCPPSTSSPTSGTRRPPGRASELGLHRRRPAVAGHRARRLRLRRRPRAAASRGSRTSTSTTSDAPRASSSTSLAEVWTWSAQPSEAELAAGAGDRPARRAAVGVRSRAELARTFGSPG